MSYPPDKKDAGIAGSPTGSQTKAVTSSLSSDPSDPNAAKHAAADGLVHPGSEDHLDDFGSGLTQEQIKKVERKVDLHLVPWLAFLYLLSFLDRSAIGNAKLYDIRQDLGIDLNGPGFNIALTLFFIPYALFEIPSNVLLKRLRPSIWFPIITILVGICMLSQGLVHNLGGLITARVFLGVTEAGLFPGVNFLLLSWYRRSQFSIRAAIFFSAATLAGAFGGLLSAAIVQMDGVGGFKGWRWIFILIGLVTVVSGVASFWLVPDFPDTAKFLSEPERLYVINKLQNDHQYSAKGEAFNWLNIWKAVLDPKVWISAMIYAGCDGPLYAFSLFTPTIVKAAFPGSSGTKANLLSVPIYALACLQVISLGILTSRVGRRALANLIMMSIGAAGYVILLASENFPLSYAAIYIGAFGIYACIPNTIALTSNFEGAYKRSVTTAFIIGFGNLNGAVTSGAIYHDPDAPHYRLGHGIVLLYLCLGIFFTSLYWFLVARENRLRESGARDETILDESLPAEERAQIVQEAFEKRLQHISETSSNPLSRWYNLMQAKTHSLPGGTYGSVAEAKAKKGDSYSGHRYST